MFYFFYLQFIRGKKKILRNFYNFPVISITLTYIFRWEHLSIFFCLHFNRFFPTIFGSVHCEASLWISRGLDEPKPTASSTLASSVAQTRQSNYLYLLLLLLKNIAKKLYKCMCRVFADFICLKQINM